MLNNSAYKEGRNIVTQINAVNDTAVKRTEIYSRI